jgi:hypothetical protein
VPRARLVGAVDAVAVKLAGPHLGQVAVPDLVGEFGQFDPLDLACPRLSNRQSSTFVAWAENSAKFVPDPSHCAPRRTSEPASSRREVWTAGAAMASMSVLRREEERRERWQGERGRGGLAVHPFACATTRPPFPAPEPP